MQEQGEAGIIIDEQWQRPGPCHLCVSERAREALLEICMHRCMLVLVFSSKTEGVTDFFFS